MGEALEFAEAVEDEGVMTHRLGRHGGEFLDVSVSDSEGEDGDAGPFQAECDGDRVSAVRESVRHQDERSIRVSAAFPQDFLRENRKCSTLDRSQIGQKKWFK